jgi:hypothetical protein
MPLAPGRSWIAALFAAACLLAVGTAVAGHPLALQAPVRSGYGAGLFSVDGASNTTFSLSEGGTYYLGVATDDGSGYVNASVVYNETLAAQLNESGSAASLVSLGPGNYSIALQGQGRAALGWDFTDGSVQNFPDNETVVAFLRPASAHIEIVVSLGNAREIHIEVYDDRLLPVTGTNVTASGSVSVDLPAARDSSAYLIASVVSGSPGVFGLAWSSPAPAPPASDVGAQILGAVLWIAVPVLLALLLFVALGRRRRGRP